MLGYVVRWTCYMFIKLKTNANSPRYLLILVIYKSSGISQYYVVSLDLQ